MDMARMQAVADKTRAFYETNTAGCALLKVKEISLVTNWPPLGRVMTAFPFMNLRLSFHVIRIVLQLYWKTQLETTGEIQYCS